MLHIDAQRDVIRKVKRSHPFKIIPRVVLPNHLHCIGPCLQVMQNVKCAGS